ncbi:MAG: ImmA/IrrE family metallo-endopeptidase [Anaerovoracaceae bacterium]
MTKYEALLSEYEERLCVEERPMVNEGLYCDNVIWINDQLPESRRVCILAEEIGHYETTVGDILDQRDMNNARQELRARKWAYNKLLSVDMIIDAAARGHTEVYDMAEYLCVDEEFLREYLAYQGILDISL